MAAKLTPAVAYIRMSSGKQEASPDQQRAEVAKLAKQHGCKIIREYFDEAISGDATEKRKAFQRMIRDAEEKGDFAAILCWDQDRFGRFDSIEAGRWIYPLREAGVWLITVAQGAIDWNDFAGRMIYSIQQEGKHQFLIDQARNSLRGRIAAAKRGGGYTKPCYGYDRVYFDEKGAVARRVPYGEKFTKPRGWRVVLAPSEDLEIVATVKWLFDTFANTDCSMLWLLRELNRRKSPKMPRKGWSSRGVEYMLKNPAYTGARIFGRRQTGKYCHIGADGSLERGKGNGDGKPAVDVPGAHEALVALETFERVQAKLAERSNGKTRPRYSRYVLSGLLRCGHCGEIMAGDAGGFGKGTHTTRYYRCKQKGNCTGECPSGRIRQDDIEDYVLGYVEKRLFAPGAVEAIRRAVFERVKRAPGHQADTRSLKAKVVALDKKIAKGTENLLLADAEDIPDLSRLLGEWREDRARLQSQLEAAATKPGGQTAEEITRRAVAKLEGLQDGFKTGDPLKVRAVVKSLIADIQVWFEPNGKRKRVTRGVITPRHVRGFIGSTPGGGRCRSP